MRIFDKLDSMIGMETMPPRPPCLSKTNFGYMVALLYDFVTEMLAQDPSALVRQ